MLTLTRVYQSSQWVYLHSNIKMLHSLVSTNSDVYPLACRSILFTVLFTLGCTCRRFSGGFEAEYKTIYSVDSG
jgi:hypothetical protein